MSEQEPPKPPDPVPHATSAWATNGLSHRIASDACRRSPFRSDLAGAVEEGPHEERADDEGERRHERQARRCAGAAGDRGEEDPDRAEPDDGGEEDGVAPDHVVGRDPAEDEHEGRHRDRREDEDEHPGERAEELAEDDRERGDRRDRQELERLVLALAADRRSRRRGREDRNHERLQLQQPEEDAAPDRRRGVGRLGAVRIELREALLVHPLEHPGEDREQQDVQRDDDEGPPAAHSPPQLLDDDRGDAGRGSVAREPRQPPGQRETGCQHAHATASAASASSRSVTWRNSSWRSVAAGA